MRCLCDRIIPDIHCEKCTDFRVAREIGAAADLEGIREVAVDILKAAGEFLRRPAEKEIVIRKSFGNTGAVAAQMVAVEDDDIFGLHHDVAINSAPV